MTAVTLTEEQIAQYERDGAVLIKGFLTQEERDLLEKGLEETYENPGKRHSKLRSEEGRGETFLETFPSQRAPSLKQLMAKGRIPELAARMIRVPSVQLILDQAFYKKPGYINPTPWHQDTPFLRVRGDDMVRVWLSADPSPANLTLQVVRGSHRWNVVYSGKPQAEGRFTKSEEGKLFEYAEDQQDSEPVAPDIARYPDSFDILSWDVAPGDALVFNGNMLHGTGGSEHNPNPRRAFACLWGGPELRYYQPKGHAIPTPAEVNGYSVPSGDRIGDHTDALPIGWRQGS